jgi:type I restriction enzyme S subunit
MKKWVDCQLKDISSYWTGKVESSNLCESNYISTDNLIPDKGGIVESNYVPKSGKANSFSFNDVLVSNIRPYFKKIWFADKAGGCSNDVLVFRAKEVVEPLFLYYQLSKDAFFDDMVAGSNGTKMPRGNKASIMEFKLQIPPLLTQRKIASILSAYDDLIENNLKRIKLLEEQAFLKYKIIVNSEKLEILKLNEVTQVLKRGISPKYVNVDGIIVINQKCIRNHILSFESARLTDSDKKPSLDRMLQRFDTLINSTGTGTLGRIAMNIQDEMPITVDSHVTIVRANEKISPIFLCQSLFSQEQLIESMGEGSTNQTELSSRKLGEEIKISIPPKLAMNEFEKQAQNIFVLIWNLQKQNTKLREARDILLPKLMSGQIEV